MMAGAQATVLDHEATPEGSRAAGQQEPWVLNTVQPQRQLQTTYLGAFQVRENLKSYLTYYYFCGFLKTIYS